MTMTHDEETAEAIESAMMLARLNHPAGVIADALRQNFADDVEVEKIATLAVVSVQAEAALLDPSRMSGVEALTGVLVLGILAPTEEQTARAIALADLIAAELSEAQVEAAKTAAWAAVNEEGEHGH